METIEINTAKITQLQELHEKAARLLKCMRNSADQLENLKQLAEDHFLIFRTSDPENNYAQLMERRRLIKHERAYNATLKRINTFSQ